MTRSEFSRQIDYDFYRKQAAFERRKAIVELTITGSRLVASWAKRVYSTLLQSRANPPLWFSTSRSAG